jgi:hypothetical protein
MSTAALLSFVAGCGSAGVSISGTITLDQAPLAKGVIKFVPAASVPGPAVAVDVVDGNYVASSDDGLVAGDYTVEIYTDQPPTPGLDEPATYIALGGPQGKLKEIPNTVDPKFSTHSVLKVQLTQEGHTFNFDVTSAGALFPGAASP